LRLSDQGRTYAHTRKAVKMKPSLSRILMGPMAVFGPFFMVFDEKTSGWPFLIHFVGALMLALGLLIACKRIGEIEDASKSKQADGKDRGGA